MKKLWFSDDFIKMLEKYKWIDISLIESNILNNYLSFNSLMQPFDLWNIVMPISIDVWLWKTYLWLFSSLLYNLYIDEEIKNKILKLIKSDKNSDSKEIKKTSLFFEMYFDTTRNIVVISNKAILK